MDVKRPDSETTVRLAGCDMVYRCATGATVLQALAPVHHRGIRSGCHGGGCGVCRIRVVSGDYVAHGMSRAHVTASDEADRITLACRTWPRTAVVVEPLGKLNRRPIGPAAAPLQQGGSSNAAAREKLS